MYGFCHHYLQANVGYFPKRVHHFLLLSSSRACMNSESHLNTVLSVGLFTRTLFLFLFLILELIPLREFANEFHTVDMQVR